MISDNSTSLLSTQAAKESIEECENINPSSIEESLSGLASWGLRLHSPCYINTAPLLYYYSRLCSRTEEISTAGVSLLDWNNAKQTENLFSDRILNGHSSHLVLLTKEQLSANLAGKEQTFRSKGYKVIKIDIAGYSIGNVYLQGIDNIQGSDFSNGKDNMVLTLEQLADALNRFMNTGNSILTSSDSTSLLSLIANKFTAKNSLSRLHDLSGNSPDTNLQTIARMNPALTMYIHSAHGLHLLERQFGEESIEKPTSVAVNIQTNVPEPALILSAVGFFDPRTADTIQGTGNIQGELSSILQSFLKKISIASKWDNSEEKKAVFYGPRRLFENLIALDNPVLNPMYKDEHSFTEAYLKHVCELTTGG